MAEAVDTRPAPSEGAGPAGDHPTERFGYQPALDGVRALAVAAVLGFHGQVSWMRGGYLGVSVFFTLSGFLITSLLLGEHARTGRVDPLAFYGRRIRRLLPASAVCLLGISALAAAGHFALAPDLRRGTVAAALQVFNWAKLTGSDSYAALFARAAAGGSDPLDHYWSLAIEEQFYWVWPLVFVVLARLGRRRGWSMVPVLAVPAAAAVLAAPVIARIWGPDAAYWSTPARVGEILTGAVAAAVVAERRLPRWVGGAAGPCLALIVAGCVFLPTTTGPAYEGLFPALSLVSVGLVLGLQQPGPVRRALSFPPLVWLGTVSYGVYLFHWPVFVLLDRERLDVGPAALFAARVAVTLVIAAASFHLLERPIRRARIRPRVTFVVGAALTALIVVAAVVAIPASAPESFGPDGGTAAAGAIDPSGPVGPLTTTDPLPALTAPGGGPVARLTAPAPSRPVRIVVAGDSTAEATGGGLVTWAVAHPRLAQVSLVTAAGCGFTRHGIRRFDNGTEEAEAPRCADYLGHHLADEVARLRPDVVVLMNTSWDVLDQRWGDGPVVSPSDATYRRHVTDDYTALTRRLLRQGARRVVWLRQPTVNPYWFDVRSVQEDPARHAVLHRTMAALAAADPTQVRVADLAGWVTLEGLDEVRDARPDGVHWSPAAADRLARRWLGPLLVTEALR